MKNNQSEIDKKIQNKCTKIELEEQYKHKSQESHLQSVEKLQRSWRGRWILKRWVELWDNRETDTHRERERRGGERETNWENKRHWEYQSKMNTRKWTDNQAIETEQESDCE